MQQVFPDYYTEFSCIAGRCRHSCCIGWEIDIDENTLAYYKRLSGSVAERLSQNIATQDTAHFILDEHERCPFLNEHNLCDLILTLGEESLCQICTDHPRFRNTLPDRVEIGVGLCCEAAGQLILGKSDPVQLLGEPDTDDTFILLRNEIIRKLQDRSMPIRRRLNQVLELSAASIGMSSVSQWADFLISLERLEEEWTDLLHLLKTDCGLADYKGFDAHMADRQSEYEQFCVYLAYRHIANAADETDFAARAAFVAFGYMVLYTLGAILWTKNHDFSFEDQVDLARHFSSEIEYSDENLNAVLDALVPFDEDEFYD